MGTEIYFTNSNKKNQYKALGAQSSCYNHSMGHHGYSNYGSPFSNQPAFQEEKLRSFIRKNRKKILIALAIGAVLVFLAVIFIGYITLTLLSAGKDAVLNPDTINQAQKIASEGTKIVPQNLPSNELMQNFLWIINIINTLQSLGG